MLVWRRRIYAPIVVLQFCMLLCFLKILNVSAYKHKLFPGGSLENNRACTRLLMLNDVSCVVVFIGQVIFCSCCSHSLRKFNYDRQQVHACDRWESGSSEYNWIYTSIVYAVCIVLRLQHRVSRRSHVHARIHSKVISVLSYFKV